MTQATLENMDVAQASDAPLAIDLHDVAKTYRGKVQALRGISMHITRGAVFGLLGPNGAGKSTLVKILMTVIRPNRCTGTVLGKPVGHKPTLARIGYLPEHHRFPDYLTGSQVLDFYGALAEVDRRTRKARAAELLELVGMSEWRRKRVKSYSKGMAQRLGIANALIMNPELVLLDEPTDGVDPVGRRDIRNILLRLKDEGRTVFLNSHLLSELEMVCDRVAILVKGVVAQQGTIEELTTDGRCYLIELEGEPAGVAVTFHKALASARIESPDQDADPELRLRGKTAAGQSLELRGTTMRVGTTDPHVIQPILDGVRACGGVIRSVRPMRPSLEDLFMKAVTDPTTGEVLTPGAAGREDRS